MEQETLAGIKKGLAAVWKQLDELQGEKKG